MALDLQLSTQAARSQIEALEKSVAGLKAAFNGFRVTKGFENTLSALAGFQGVPSSAAESIGTLATNLNKINEGSAGRITALVKALRGLVGLKLDNLAGQIGKVNEGLRLLRAPPAVGRLAGQLAQIGDAARRAAGGVNTLQSSLARVRPPAGLGGLAGQLRQLQQLSRQAGSGVGALGGAMRGVTALASGFGLALGGLGLARFIEGSYNAINSTDRFMALMKQFAGSAEGAGEELKFVRGVADNLAQPIGTLQDSYSKLAIAMKGAGAGSDTIRSTFEKFSTVFRVLNLSQEQVGRGFKGIEQVYTKGAVQMEELKGQLGELFPAFTLLAKGMGVSTSQLMKLISTGSVPASAMTKLADAAIAAYGGALPDSLKTASAAFNNFSNAIFRMQESFGRGFFEGVTPAINQLSQALNNVDIQKNIQDIGRLAGELTGTLINAIQFVITHWNQLKYALGALVGLKAISMIGGFALSLGKFAAAARLGGAAAGLAAAGFGRLAIAAGNIAFVFGGIYRAVVPVIGMIIRLVASLTPVGRILTALGFVVTGAVAVWDNYANASETAGTSTGTVSTQATNAVGPMGSLADAADQAQTAMTSLSKVREIAAIAELKRLAEEAQRSGATATEVAEKYKKFWDAVSGFSGEAATAVANMQALAKAAAAGNPEANTKFWQAYGEAMRITGQAAAEAKGPITQSGTATKSAGQAAEEAAADTSKLTSSTGGLASGLSKIPPKAQAAKAALQSYSSACIEAADNSDEAAAAMGRSIRESWAATEAAGRARDARDASFNEWEAANAYTRGSGPDDRLGSSHMFSGGGIVGKPPARTTHVAASAFVGAKHFAGGGISDGGIPAILHPNEAVVPLTGGGQIPVANVSQGQGSLLLYKPLNELLVLTRLQRNDVSRVVDQLQILTSLMKEEFDQVQVRQDFLANDRMTQLMKLIAGNFASLENKIGSGGGGGSSGGGGGGFGGIVDGGSSKIDQISALTDVQIKRIEAYGPHLGGTGGPLGGAIMYNGKVVAVRSPQGAAAMADMVQKDLDLLKARYAAGLVSDAELSRRLNALKKGEHVGSFARGSPNASKDMKGGFHATLHKDEAVIPLPDGRSVPVSFSGGIDARLTAVKEELLRTVNGNARDLAMMRSRPQTSAAGGNAFNIVMHFPNADAQSFKASAEQIKQTLRAELDRATRKIGVRSRTDDPTVSNPRTQRPNVSLPR